MDTVLATDGAPAPLALTTEPGREDDFRAQVAGFAATRVAPLVLDMDQRARYAPDLVADLFAAGLMGIEVPEAYGGLAGTLTHSIVAIEELARVDPAVAVLVDVQNALLCGALLRFGSGDQKRRWLPALANGTVGAYAISEKDAGSDAFAMTTRAERDGDRFVLTGAKAWTTSAAEAGLFLVFARTGGDDNTPTLTAFLVERGAAGLTVGARIDKLGIRASSTCPVELAGVRVGRENVLGRPDNGATIAIETLNVGKLGIAAQLVGLARGALDVAVAYAEQRRQFGRPVAEFQGVRFPLAHIAAEIEAARALLYQTVREFQVDTLDPGQRLRAAAMAKLIAADVAERAATQAVETLGGFGFTPAGRAEKFYRDAKVGKIYEGTTNVQLRTISARMFAASATSNARVSGAGCDGFGAGGTDG